MSPATVREIAATTPAAVRVFEKYKIDYCCGGQRALEEVCRERGISAEAVLAEVQQAGQAAGQEPDWSQANLSDLSRHIINKHHKYLNAELPALEARMRKVMERHGPNHPELQPLEDTFLALKSELESHLMKEEMLLFPAIAELEAAESEGCPPAMPAFGTVQNPIRMMMHEHDAAGDALREMRRLTSGYAPPVDACQTYRALYTGLEELERDTHTHIHLENNILFPRAAELEMKLM